MISLCWSVLVVVFRVALVIRVFLQGGALPIMFGVSESLALLTTLYSLRYGKRDVSLSSFVCPLCYLAPLLFNFNGEHFGPSWGASVYLCCVPFIWALRVRLGLRCTVGAPCFVSLVPGFPYTFVRHPLAAFEIFGCAFVALWCGTGYAAAVYLLVLSGGVFAVLSEESFLMRFPEYVAYARRVPCRFVPGVL